LKQTAKARRISELGVNMESGAPFGIDQHGTGVVQDGDGPVQKVI
jgi:hypothetical protein